MARYHDPSADSSQSPWVERGVPTFNGEMEGYREYRRRAMLYMVKMKAEKKEQVAGVNLLTGLSGKAWQVVESIDPTKLVEASETEKMMQILDASFQYDERTQLPRELENFFTKLSRDRNETILTFSTRFQRSLNRLVELDLVLPDAAVAWLFLRKSGLSSEQRSIILSQTDTKLTLSSVQRAVYFTFGQDSKIESKWSKDKETAFYQDDYDEDWDDEYYDYEPDEYEEAYYENDWYEYDDDDAPFGGRSRVFLR